MTRAGVAIAKTRTKVPVQTIAINEVLRSSSLTHLAHASQGIGVNLLNSASVLQGWYRKDKV